MIWIDRNQDGTGVWQVTRARSAFWVFQITLPAEGGQEGDIQLLGQIEHNAPVRRSLRIDDYLYSISEGSIKVHPILDPGHQAANLSLSNEARGLAFTTLTEPSPRYSVRSAALATAQRSSSAPAWAAAIGTHT